MVGSSVSLRLQYFHREGPFNNKNNNISLLFYAALLHYDYYLDSTITGTRQYTTTYPICCGWPHSRTSAMFANNTLPQPHDVS